MVGAVVAERQLVGAPAGGQPEDLVAEADPEHRHAAEEAAHRLDQVGHALGIAGTVGEKDAVGLALEHAAPTASTAGTTVTSQPAAPSWRRMLSLIPESYATTLKRGGGGGP